MKHLFNTFTNSFFMVACILGGAFYRSYIDKINIPAFSTDLLFALNEKGLAVRNIPETQYFEELSRLIQEKYVDHVQIDEKFSLGAIQGMISYLKDPSCKVMDDIEYKSYKKNIVGEFEGIGLELTLQFNKEQKQMIQEKKFKDIYSFIPDLIVHSVIPNSPAEAAGFVPGDRIDRVNNRWVVQANSIKKIRKLTEESLKDDHKKKILIEERKRLNAEYKKAHMPLKAKKLLTEGCTGKIHIQWQSEDGKIHTGNFNRQKILVSPFYKIKNKDAYQIRFIKGVDKMLANTLEKEQSITLDFREGLIADFDYMQKCLEILLPKGSYGQLKQGNKILKSLMINSGQKKPYSIKVLINDESTDVAKIFVTALKNHSNIVCEGKINSTELYWTELFEVPKGAYIIPTSIYVPKLKVKK